jgi:hypothetical protein
MPARFLDRFSNSKRITFCAGESSGQNPAQGGAAAQRRNTISIETTLHQGPFHISGQACRRHHGAAQR